jgi:hypothetical protein
MRQGRRRCLQRREGQDDDPFRRRRADGDAGASEPPVERDLDDEAAEGVADEDRRLVELTDQLG